MSPEIKGLLISYAFLFGVLIFGELIRMLMRLPTTFTRKFIHVGVGFWGFVAYFTLDSWLVIIPPASFVLVNLISYRWTLIKAMEIEDKSNLGTIYYPLALCILLAAFWGGDRLIALIGLLVMALGDGFASVIGQRWGKHKYRLWKREKSWEGSTAMFLFSVAAVCLVLFPLSSLPFSAVLWRAAAVGLLAAIIEGLSPWGVDNLTVPLLTGLVYSVWF